MVDKPLPVKTKILIVDDDTQQSQLIADTLSNEGYEALTALDGLDALEKLESFSPAVILTDLNMPRMDGFELIRRVRQDRRLSRTPIIVVSADTDPATPGRIADLGVDAFFPKPFSPAQVRRRLEQLLNATTQ